MTATTRVERDSMGALDVPASALWGAQTQRAIAEFSRHGTAHAAWPSFAPSVSSSMPPPPPTPSSAICPLDLAAAIQAAALEVAAGRHDEHFPVDVFQTGSGTSSNMNANEVIAALASRALSRAVHPNDHVNMSQSSNDVVPTAIHVAAALLLHEQSAAGARAPARGAWAERAAEFADVVKTGRTHLMDAMPVTLAQELGAWQAQIDRAAGAPDVGHARACTGWRRAAPRSAPASTPARNSAPRLRAVSATSHRARVPAQRQLFRGLVEPGHGGGTVGPTQGP